MTIDDLLKGAYDIHLHCAPDVVPRSDDVVSLAHSARDAGLAGIVIKDHNTSTIGRVVALNKLIDGPTRFHAALVLNHAVGGVNPVAARAALRAGASIIYMPTNSSAHQYALGLRPPLDAANETDPDDDVGISVLDDSGAVSAAARRVCELIAEHDAVLGTGHISPEESLKLLAVAREIGVTRMVVTHASQPVPGMSIADQQRCAELGALIEHSFLACTSVCGEIPLDVVLEQVRAVGIEHCVLSSDFGQPVNGPIVAAYRHWLQRTLDAGFSADEIRTLIVDNPRRLLP